MKKSLIIMLLAPLFCACDKSEEATSDPQTEVDKLINIQIGANEATTKVSYEPNDDNSIYYFSWELGDEVSVIVPDTDNTNQKFTATTSEASTTLDGQIATWDGGQTLFAVYPYFASGYTIDSDSKTLFFDNTTQTIDATAGNSYKNGLMVVAVDGATATSEDSYYIPDLSFMQVMSFFELELTDIPEGERCTTIGFECGTSSFVASADINLSSGEVTPHTYSSSISATIENQSGTESSINFALLPTDLSNTAITLYISTISETDTKKYTYQIEGGINFSSNSFLYNDSGALSLTNDFTEAGAGELYLADFDDGFIPEDDTWVIYDTEATTASFTGLKSALDNVYTADNSRRISIEFPNLNAIPNNAFYDSSSTYKYALQSVSAPASLSIGEYAFYYCSNLTDVEFPLISSIGGNAFYCCRNISTIYFPMTTTLGDYAFMYCSNLISIELPLVSSIGVNAFDSCSSLVSAEIPLITAISDNAFCFCSSLEIIECPLVTSLDAYAFFCCKSLESINLPLVTSINAYAFSNCETLTNVYAPLATYIGIDAFMSCKLLETIELPSVSVINRYAFAYCDALTSIYFPSVTSLSSGVFASCPLVNVEFPSLVSIGDNAFDSCYVLESVICPIAVSILESTFVNCSSLKYIDFPSITSISTSAFSGCVALTDIELPAVTTIGDSAFYGCDALRTMSIATDEDVVLSSLGTNIFQISDSVNNEENITLTMGLSNKENVVDNTLTVSDNSYTFSKIILSGGSQSGISASSSDGVGNSW